MRQPRLFAALPTALALTLTEDDQRERKLTLLLSQTRIKLGRLARMGALALRTKRRSERRRIEFATDRAAALRENDRAPAIGKTASTASALPYP
jgi:hypothetical protein